MKVYQLIASGPKKYFSGEGMIPSKKAFLSKDKAEEYIGTFKDICCNNGDKLFALTDLDPDTVRIKVVELDIIE